MERKLTAILCADVHGYGRLMEEDEEATVRTLASHRKIIDALIGQHHGRFVNSAGDSVLAEFASVVNAVQCGIETQAALTAENAHLPPARRMEFRIGINLGDVIVDGEQIYGDGVNVAARLESLAEPGGICISHRVHDYIKNRLPLSYANLGEQRVKNIAEPVLVFRVLNAPNGRPSTGRRPERVRKLLRRGAVSFAGIALIIGTIVAVQNLSLRPPAPTASIPPAKPALALPDKPSIAVLPFTNLSGDREQEYFSDGITDDLISDLSRLPGLFVIARDSTFTYKGKPAKLQDVSRELGVKYVLGGNVRKAAGLVRITVQLADATTGANLWAERYDRPLRDVFALQDEIVRRIVTTLNLQLALSQQGFQIPRSTENLEAYDNVLRGMGYFLSFTKDGNAKARQMFEKAIELDPKYAYAYASLGWNYDTGWAFALNPDRRGLEQALEMAQQATALDDSLAAAHSILAVIYVHKGQNDQALTEAQRSIALDPNSAFAYSTLANVLNVQLKPAQALAAVEKAMRLDPRNRANYLLELGWAYIQLGRWEEAIRAVNGDLARHPDSLWAHAFQAIGYFNLGDRDAARAETAQVERVVALAPNSAIGYLALASALEAQGKPVDALAVADHGYAIDPLNPLILFLRGALYYELGRWEESVADLKRDVGLGSNNVWNNVSVHGVLANDYAALGQIDAARAEAAEVKRIFDRDPNSAVGFWELSFALDAQGKETESLATLEKAMRLDPGNRVKYLWAQGHVYTRLGRWEEAIIALKDYLARYPEQVLAHVELAVDYIEAGREDAARTEVAVALRLDPQFSPEIGAQAIGNSVDGEFHMGKKRVAADLIKAGLK